jgi:hypothetical protein
MVCSQRRQLFSHVLHPPVVRHILVGHFRSWDTEILLVTWYGDLSSLVRFVPCHDVVHPPAMSTDCKRLEMILSGEKVL